MRLVNTDSCSGAHGGIHFQRCPGRCPIVAVALLGPLTHHEEILEKVPRHQRLLIELFFQFFQGALLAQKDTASPAIAIGSACLVNTVLDIILIGGMGFGVAGAAWATLFAQLMECAATVWALFKRGKVRRPLGVPPACVVPQRRFDHGMV